MSWVKFHDELTQGAKRGLPRSARFVYLELCLLARKGRGVVVLPVGMRDVDAVCDVLGGDRTEVRKALTLLSLRSSPEVEPMIRFEDAPAGRALVIVAWEKWNKVDDSAARVARYREKRNAAETEDVTRYTSVSNAAPPLPEKEREKEREKEQSTHTLRAGASAREGAGEGAREGRPVEPRPAPERPPMSAEAGQVLDALRGHEVLGPVADVRFAETLDGRRAGRPVAWVVRAIADAAADTPGGETAQAIQRRVRAYCDRARSPDAERATTARSGPAMQAVVPDGTGWKANEARLRAEQEAWLREAGKDAPL